MEMTKPWTQMTDEEKNQWLTEEVMGLKVSPDNEGRDYWLEDTNYILNLAERFHEFDSFYHHENDGVTHEK